MTVSNVRAFWPEGILAPGSAADEFDASWWVMHTRPRAEKVFARRLLAEGVPYFLPQCERRRRLQGRWVVSYLPLFPGYVFLRTDEVGRLIALRTNVVVRCLPVANQRQLATRLAEIRRLIESGLPISPEGQLGVGTPARVVSGPLAGLEGKVIRTGDGPTTKLYIEVELLHRSVSVEIDASLIERMW